MFGRRFISFTLVAALVASLVTPVLFSQIAKADTTDDMLKKAGAAWAALRVIRDTHVTDDGALPANWVNNVGYVGNVGCWSGSDGGGQVGYLVASDDKGYLARDTGATCFPGAGIDPKEAYSGIFSYLGLNPVSFVNALGYKEDSDGKYHGGSFDDAKLNAVLKKSWPASLGEPNIGGATPDWLKYLDLTEGATKIPCTAAGLTKFPDPNGNIWLVNGTSVARYKVTATDTGAWFDAKFGFAVGRDLSCRDVVNELGSNGKLANAYLAAYKKAQPDTPKTCEEKYIGLADELKACIDGFEHASVPNYCATTYKITGMNDTIASVQAALKSACDYGHDKASGAAGKKRTLTGKGESGKITCTIQGVGWIMCPVITFLSNIADSAYGVVASMLTLQALDTVNTTNSNALYTAWSIVRNLANVCFVIAFLIIIYSQITSVGISNYGIKKMLPKLVVAAVLVNISYWVCALAVDLSNFLGYAISRTFEALGSPITEVKQTAFNSSSSFSNIATTMLAIGGAAMFIQLATLLPLLIGAVLVIVAIVIILTIRQGLIIILIVISPLAFVAYLLPNTSKLFSSWWSAFKALLLMFPVIAFVYAGSQLAGKVLSNVADKLPSSDPTKIPLQIMAAALPILSFITVYTIMKTSSALIGKVLNNNPAKGIGDRMKRGAENRGKRWDNQRGAYANKTGGFKGFAVGGRARARARGKAIDRAAEHNLNVAEAGYMSDAVKSSGGSLTNRISRGRLGSENRLSAQLGRGLGESGQASALANAIHMNLDLEAKEVSAQKAIIRDLNLNDNQKAELASGRSVVSSSGRIIDGSGTSSASLAIRMAAQQSVVEGGDAGAINRVITHMSSVSAVDPNGAKELNNFADSLEKSSNKPSYVQPKNLVEMRQNGLPDGNGGTMSLGTADEVIRGAIHDNVYSADKMATTGRQEMGEVKRVAKSLETSHDQRDSDGLVRLMENAQKATSDPRLAPRLGKQREIVEGISKGNFS